MGLNALGSKLRELSRSLAPTTSHERHSSTTPSGSPRSRPTLPDDSLSTLRPDCDVCGDTHFIRREVAVDHPDFGKAFDCPKCTRRRLADSIRRSMPTFVRDATFAATDLRKPGSPRALTSERDGLRWRAAVTSADRLARNESTYPWLVLESKAKGTGKTHLAACFVNERLAHDGLAVPEWVGAVDLLDRIRRGYGDGTADEVREHYKTTSCLVLDDLGAEMGTADEKTNLYRVLNYRYEERLETVITTNGDISDARLASRLEDALLVMRCGLEIASYRSGRS